MVERTHAGALTGVGVLVTRAATQADALVALLEDAGARVHRLPALAIEPAHDRQQVADLRTRLAQFQLAVFVSANAVHHGLPLLQAAGALPSSLAVAAVGEATARALHVAGIHEVTVPTGRFDSEALLALPALTNVAGKRILIVSGEGGRELLAHTLTARGARVEHLCCYRRVLPEVDVTPVLTAWRGGEIDIVTATSVDALQNLHALLGPEGQAQLAGSVLVVVSERIAQAARALGIGTVLVSEAASDGAILRAILAWRANTRRA